MDLNWAYIIPILLVLILIHELGHFFAARWVGITVEEFGFGLPPRLIGINHGGVIYSINALPVGGFVRMLGEERASNDPTSFNQKSPAQRALVTGAGALMNFLFAVILLAGIAMGYGRPSETGRAEITGIIPGSPAAAAGWQPGDIIRGVGGQPIPHYRQLSEIISQYGDKPVAVELERAGQIITTTVTPRANPPRGQGATGMTIEGQKIYSRMPIWEAVPSAVVASFQISGMMLDGLRLMILKPFNPEVDIGPVAGPVGMGQLVGEAVTRSPLPLWVTLANLTALLSLNLFLINLLPLPALDGGRLLFIIIEVLRGRRIHPDREGMVHFVGMLVLLAMIAVISVFDINRLFNGQALLP